MNTKTLLARTLHHATRLLAVGLVLPMLACGKFGFSNSAANQKGTKKVTIVLSGLQLTSTASVVDLGTVASQSPITVTAIGSNNLPMAVSNASGLVVTINGFSTGDANLFALKADGTCSPSLLPNNSLTIPNGVDHAGFCVQALTGNVSPSAPVGTLPTLTLKANAASLPVASLTLTVHQIPARVYFETTITSVDLSICTPVGIPLVVEDFQAKAMYATFNPISVSLTGVAGMAYLTSDCSGTPISGPLSLTSATTLIYINTGASSAASITMGLSGVPSNLGSNSKTFSINSVPFEMAYSQTPAAATMFSNQISPDTAQVKIRNAIHIAQNIGNNPLTISIAASTGSANFYIDNGGVKQQTNSVTVNAGSADSQAFYIKPLATGTLKVRIAASYTNNAGVTRVLVAPLDLTYSVGRNVASVGLTGPSGAPVSITAGITSGRFTFTLYDAGGSTYAGSPGAAITVNYSAGLAGATRSCKVAKCPPGSFIDGAGGTAITTDGTSTSYDFYLLTDIAADALNQTISVSVGGVTSATFAINATRTPLAPDTMFSALGQLSYGFSSNLDSEILGAASVSNNSIVAVGYKGTSNPVGGSRNVAMVKIFGTNSPSAGQYDTTFNGTGKVEFFLLTEGYSYGVAVAPVQINNHERYLVGVQGQGADYDFALARVCPIHAAPGVEPGCPNNASDYLDQTFTPGVTTGHVVFSYPGNQRLKAMAVNANGNAYLVGTTDNNVTGAQAARSDTDLLIIATDSGGNLLTNFNATGAQPGVLQQDISSGSVDDVFSAVLSTGTDGKERLTVGATMSVTTGGNTVNSYVLLRYTTLDGKLDTTFGTGGKVTVATASSNDVMQPAALLMLSTKMLVVAFNHSNSATSVQEIILKRFRESGAVDTAVGNNGQTLLSAPGHAQTASGLGWNAIDGEIYLSGTDSDGSGENFLAWRLMPSTLTPDTAGSNENTYNFGYVTPNHSNGMLIDGEKPLLYGQAHLPTSTGFAFLSLLR